MKSETYLLLIKCFNTNSQGPVGEYGRPGLSGFPGQPVRAMELGLISFLCCGTYKAQNMKTKFKHIN